MNIKYREFQLFLQMIAMKINLTTLIAKIKESPVFFSIKNDSILNGHNFGPERRSEIKKKKKTTWISEPNFVRS